jgi:Flp pilus assembly pilin Flp
LSARFVREDAGQDLVEYAVLIGLITVALVASITALGTPVKGKLDDVETILAPYGDPARVVHLSGCLCRVSWAARRDRQLPYDRTLVDRLLEDYFRPRGIGLRGCQPRDLVNQALAHAEYVGAPRGLTYELLEAACAGYFVDDANA